MSGRILIVIIMVVSMAIAYMGDVLGKRIGKKRISIFGLRPRYTAIVITVITGGVIALGTFVVLISLSAPMRQMLLETEKIYQGMQTAIQEKNALQKQVDDNKRDAMILSDQIVNSQNEVARLTAERDNIKAESDGYQTRITEMQTQIETLGKHQKELESQLSKSDSDLKELNSALEKVNGEKIQVQGAVASLKSNLGNLEQQIKTKENAIKNLNDDISKKNTEIKKMQTGELAFYDGQRLYGFTISNSLPKKDILDAIEKSFYDFKKNAPVNLNCTIQKPSPDALYAVLEKVDASRAKNSIIMVFSKKNSFQGDEIPVEFQVLDQYVVFSANRLVVEERVEKKLNLLEAREMVGNIVHKAETKAFEMGLLRDPFRQMSKFTPDELNLMAEKIEKHSRPMVVRLIAGKDIYRSDYLDDQNLNFSIIDG